MAPLVSVPSPGSHVLCVIFLGLSLLLPPALAAQGPAPSPTPPSSAADLAAATRELALNHLPQAESLTREQLRLHPADPQALFLLGAILFHQQRAVDSLAAYTAGARYQTPSAADLEVVSTDYILLKDLPDAARWLHYALTLTPGDPHLWYLLGRTEYNQDHAQDAVHAFQRTLELTPHTTPEALRAEYNLGLASEKLQRPTDALAAYRTAISWQGNQAVQDPQPYLNLGDLLLSEGKSAEALPPLQQAARFGPTNPFIAQQLGLALEAEGRYTEAVAALQRASALAPDSEQPHFFLGRVLRRMGRTAEASAEYTVVSRLLGAHSSQPTPNQDLPTPN